MSFKKKHILDMASLCVDEVNIILNTAEMMKEISKRHIKKVPTLRGKTIVLFFYEPSTRTRTSFDIATKRLSGDSISISANSSSIVKGETLIDTARNIEAMNCDIIVLRHPCSGAPHMLAKLLKNTSVINAGDGMHAHPSQSLLDLMTVKENKGSMHAHPSQSLLDLMTVKENKGSIKGLRVAIIGDIAHSRVAMSNITGFTKMGADVIVAGPPTMIPSGIETFGVSVTYNIDEAICSADVIIMLRIQKERQEDFFFPTEREYSKVYGLTNKRLEKISKDAIIMHPGPINKGLEISAEAAECFQTRILNQVTNGVAVRMALLYLVAGG